jgi:hypothetical protein
MISSFHLDSSILVQVALTLAARGWPVLPVCWPTSGPDGRVVCGCGGGHTGRDIGKAPVGRLAPHGHHDATTDEAIIRRWWAACPNANVGVALDPAGLVAIDCDAEAALDYARTRGLPATVVRLSRMPAYIYRRPSDCPAGRRTPAPGLDILGDGYLVVWGQHPAGCDIRLEPWPPEPAAAPDWVVQILKEAAARRARRRTTAEAPAEGAADVPPPVRLEGPGLSLWRGEFVAVKGAEGLHPRARVRPEDVDRSRTLWHLGLHLARGGAAEHTIAVALAERDRALGLEKYADRGDQVIRYGEIASKVTDAVGGGLAQTHPAGVVDPEPAAAGPAAKPRGGREPNQATVLVEAVRRQVELWHTPDGTAFVTVAGEHWPLRGELARSWLTKVAYDVLGKAPSREAVSSAVATLEGLAVHDGPAFEVFVRLAGVGEDGRPLGPDDDQPLAAVYVDLGAGGSVVEIAPQGWRVVKEAPVRFYRPKQMAALPEPKPGGPDDFAWFLDLFRLNDYRGDLLGGFLLGALRPRGPYPVLMVDGEAGTGKTLLCRVIRRLIDPNKSELRAPPGEERDLAVSARNGWLIALSNIRGLPDWLSDALCRLATDGGFGKRQLYTDADEFIFSGRRPVVLNGIGLAELLTEARRSDLTDRALLIVLDPILPSARRREDDILAEFSARRPHILGALYQAVSRALAEHSRVSLRALPRLADLATWVTAGESALGRQQSSFVRALLGQKSGLARATVEVELLGRVLLAWAETLDSKVWEGTPTELHEILTRAARAANGDRLPPGWPNTGAQLGIILKRLGPDLREIGIQIKRRRVGDRRLVIIERCGADAAADDGSDGCDGVFTRLSGEAAVKKEEEHVEWEG